MCKAHIVSGKTNNKSSERPMIDLDYFNSTHFTKREIENICSTYGALYKASYKSKRSQELCEELVKHDTMPSSQARPVHQCQAKWVQEKEKGGRQSERESMRK